MKSLIFLFLLIFSTVDVGAFQVFGGGAASTLEGQNGSFYTDSGNLTGAINYTGISNWDTATAVPTAVTGVDEHEEGVDSCKIIVDIGDNTKIAVKENCNIHIQGPHYFFNATTIDPELGVGENSKFIGVTMNGYTSSSLVWTDAQKLTIVPLARINTVFGVSGPGSVISLIRDDRYFVTKRDYYDRLWHERAMGALYVIGGDIFANTTSGLILGQNSGILFDAQTKEQELSTFENQSAIFLHLSSNEIDWVGVKKPLTVDAVNYNPAGSSLVAMQNDNTFKVDTILKSPKGANGVPEGGLFLIYGDTEFATAAGAIAAAETRFGLFINQAISGLVPVALVVQQKNAIAVDTILDRRPCLVCRP